MKTNKKQQIMNFTAIFQQDEDGMYHVSVPALPGCYTFGSSLKEAEEKAKEVIELWLEELAVQKESLPNYRNLWTSEIKVFLPLKKSKVS